MTDEEIVAALAEALDDTATGLWMNQDAARRGDRTWGHVVAAALLPTVRHIAKQRAAEELLAAAEEMTEDVNGGRIWRDVIRHVHERAEALDPS